MGLQARNAVRAEVLGFDEQVDARARDASAKRRSRRRVAELNRQDGLRGGNEWRIVAALVGDPTALRIGPVEQRFHRAQAIFGSGQPCQKPAPMNFITQPSKIVGLICRRDVKPGVFSCRYVRNRDAIAAT